MFVSKKRHKTEVSRLLKELSLRSEEYRKLSAKEQHERAALQRVEDRNEKLEKAIIAILAQETTSPNATVSRILSIAKSVR